MATGICAWGDTVDGQARLVRQSRRRALDRSGAESGADHPGAGSRGRRQPCHGAPRCGHPRSRIGCAPKAAPRWCATGDNFTLPRSAPLAWTAHARTCPTCVWSRRFCRSASALDARLAAQLAGSGSLAAPRVNGQIDASRIRFAMPEEGVAITDGTLKLVLDDDRVRVEQGELKGQSGRIVVSGEAQLKNPQAGLDADVRKICRHQPQRPSRHRVRRHPAQSRSRSACN